MKYLLILITIMLVGVGCKQGGLSYPNTEKPPKELTLEEKFVGSYEWGETGKVHFLENGKAELYIDGKRTFELKWKIVGNEVHAAGDLVAVYRIETNGDLTQIAEIEGGKRTDFPKGQMTLKKIK